MTLGPISSYSLIYIIHILYITRFIYLEPRCLNASFINRFTDKSTASFNNQFTYETHPRH